MRFVPGTRPVRLRYASSANAIARYDALEIAWLRSQSKQGSTAIDVGAYCGSYALIMAALCGRRGSVVAFEPDPYAREVLFRNIELNPGIRKPVIESFACSDRLGKATLFSRGGNSQSSLARSAVEFSQEHSSERIDVDITTLDAYIVNNQLPPPDCVKIDAEGAEIRILMGATGVLSGGAENSVRTPPVCVAGIR